MKTDSSQVLTARELIPFWCFNPARVKPN